ncbi:phage tail protein [Fusobacterium mortiferum]|jgi:P2 family phage contractile tail tube protein|uniref:Phage tail protein n=1 Tax=Fusobacterium mortiferum TaxID=850 RepID=A0A414PR94_FUSMR|nr:phage major tail tube protein [Fusobacterium mortiferum]MCI6382855.1 phage major tail tube protein [Fusobacterium mortiferum]RHF71077.1 phage tail protein [Fusobacterium mortiferum]DAP91401.1 MAG TPA: tail tube protein [Caudoviricetes sp.]
MSKVGAGIIPEKAINYKLYVDGSSSLAAMVDVTLPNIEYLSETVSGAGIAGEIDSPTLGHTSPITLGINVRSLIGEDFKLLQQKSYTLEIRAAMQSNDQSNGKLTVGKLAIIAKGIPKNLNMGTLGVGKTTDSSKEFSLTYLKVEIDGEVVLEIDKVNMIFIVNGEDMLAEVRAALGM